MALNTFDKAVALVGREALIENALKISKENPDVWDFGWSNFRWALGNAVRDIINSKKRISAILEFG